MIKKLLTFFNFNCRLSCRLYVTDPNNSINIPDNNELKENSNDLKENSEVTENFNEFKESSNVLESSVHVPSLDIKEKDNLSLQKKFSTLKFKEQISFVILGLGISTVSLLFLVLLYRFLFQRKLY